MLLVSVYLWRDKKIIKYILDALCTLSDDKYRRSSSSYVIVTKNSLLNRACSSL